METLMMYRTMLVAIYMLSVVVAYKPLRDTADGLRNLLLGLNLVMIGAFGVLMLLDDKLRFTDQQVYLLFSLYVAALLAAAVLGVMNIALRLRPRAAADTTKPRNGWVRLLKIILIVYWAWTLLTRGGFILLYLHVL